MRYTVALLISNEAASSGDRTAPGGVQLEQVPDAFRGQGFRSAGVLAPRGGGRARVGRPFM